MAREDTSEESAYKVKVHMSLYHLSDLIAIKKKGKSKVKRSHANVTSSVVYEVSSESSSPSSEAYCVTSEQQESDELWFADSGATKHMTDKRKWFHSFQPIDNMTWSVQWQMITSFM